MSLECRVYEKIEPSILSIIYIFTLLKLNIISILLFIFIYKECWTGVAHKCHDKTLIYRVKTFICHDKTLIYRVKILIFRVKTFIYRVKLFFCVKTGFFVTTKLLFVMTKLLFDMTKLIYCIYNYIHTYS